MYRRVLPCHGDAYGRLPARILWRASEGALQKSALNTSTMKSLKLREQGGLVRGLR